MAGVSGRIWKRWDKSSSHTSGSGARTISPACALRAISRRLIAATANYAKEAAAYSKLALDPESERKLKLLKNALTLAAPADPAESAEVTRILASMEGTYGKGKYCTPGTEKCKDLEELSKILATSRDPKELRDAWVGWHTISKPMRSP